MSVLAADTARFLEYLKVERHYSPGTLRNYTHALETLTRFADGLSLAAWRDLRGEQLQTLVADEHRRGLEPPSLRALLSAYRSFFPVSRARGKDPEQSRRRRALAQGAPQAAGSAGRG